MFGVWENSPITSIRLFLKRLLAGAAGETLYTNSTVFGFYKIRPAGLLFGNENERRQFQAYPIAKMMRIVSAILIFSVLVSISGSTDGK